MTDALDRSCPVSVKRVPVAAAGLGALVASVSIVRRSARGPGWARDDQYHTDPGQQAEQQDAAADGQDSDVRS